jgi:hypothetical protein
MRARAAWVAQPNTPETDRMPQVNHVVQMEDGSRITILATDPLAALDIVNNGRVGQ